MAFLGLFGSGIPFLERSNLKNQHNMKYEPSPRKNKRILVILIVFIMLTGLVITCHAQTTVVGQNTKKFSELKSFRDSLFSRIDRVVRRSGEDSTALKVPISFMKERGILIMLRSDGTYQYATQPPEDHEDKYYKIFPIFDSDKSVIETREYKTISRTEFLFMEQTLFIPEHQIVSSWEILTVLDEAYRAYVYTKVRRYDGSYVDKIANESELADFNGKVLKAMFKPTYHSKINSSVGQVVAQTRRAKKDLTKSYSLIDSLGNQLAVTFFGSETTPVEAKLRQNLIAIQIERIASSRLYEDGDEKQAADKLYLEYVFPKNKRSP
jgi:hypothetical protein